MLLEKEQRLAVASVRTAMKVRGEYVFINTNGDMIGGACRVFHMSSIAACPLPFSVIVVWFAVEKHISHCHIAGRIDSQPSSTVHTTGGMETYSQEEITL